MAISPEERTFFITLGSRIAKRRKSLKITQRQVASALGVSQQTINSYEVGRRRVPASTIPALAKFLSVSVETLLDADFENQKQKESSPLLRLQQQIHLLGDLPTSMQHEATEMLDSFIQQNFDTQDIAKSQFI